MVVNCTALLVSFDIETANIRALPGREDPWDQSCCGEWIGLSGVLATVGESFRSIFRLCSGAREKGQRTWFGYDDARRRIFQKHGAFSVDSGDIREGFAARRIVTVRSSRMSSEL